MPQNKINRVLLIIALIFIVIRELFYSKEKLGRKPKENLATRVIGEKQEGWAESAPPPLLPLRVLKCEDEREGVGNYN